jgi:dephospho-CoA kinase
MILGVTGYIGAGKDTFVNYVAKHYRFLPLSFKEEILKEAKTRGKSESREVLQEIGRNMEERGLLTDRVMARIKEGDYVVTSFRTPKQVREFREVYGEDFTLVAVTSPLKVRWTRIRERARPGDPQDLKDFREVDDRDRGRGKYATNVFQKTGSCVRMADYTLANDTYFEGDFYRAITKFAKKELGLKR